MTSYASRRAQALECGLALGRVPLRRRRRRVGSSRVLSGRDEAGRSTLLVLDYEPNLTGPTMSLDQAREFVEHVGEATGRWPGLYSGHLIKEQLGGVTPPDRQLSQVLSLDCAIQRSATAQRAADLPDMDVLAVHRWRPWPGASSRRRCRTLRPEQVQRIACAIETALGRRHVAAERREDCRRAHARRGRRPLHAFLEREVHRLVDLSAAAGAGSARRAAGAIR